MFSVTNILMLTTAAALLAVIAASAPSKSTGMTVQATVIVS